MVKEDWYYLVRGKEVVFLTNKKPKGTEFSPKEFTWTMGGREFLAGCPDPMFLVGAIVTGKQIGRAHV